MRRSLVGPCTARVRKFSVRWLLALGLGTTSAIWAPSVQCWASQVTVAWNANTDPNVTGYKVYAGRASRSYTTTVDAGRNTTAIVSGLEEGQVYYLAAKAYGNGLESPYSTEIVYNVPVVDTDKDGLSDTKEREVYRTDPLKADTDGDGLNDGQEVSLWGSNWGGDIDGDGVSNVLDRDADGDGFSDGLEVSQGFDPANAASNPGFSEIPQTEWQLVYVDSQETVRADARAVNAFDGDVTTMWRTQWYPTDPPPPHEIRIDLGDEYDLRGFLYLPRQDGSVKGWIKGYEFYVSRDGVNWGSPVAKGVFVADQTEKKVLFPSTMGRYIRLRALSEAYGGAWTSAAEINVLAVW